MRVAPSFLRILFSFAVLAAVTPSAVAGPAGDVLLPKTTKGFVSVAHPDDAKAKWRETQFGQLLHDETMDPFVKSLRQQLGDKFVEIEKRLGLKWDDLQGVPSGEFCMAIIEREGQDAALAVTMDVTGRSDQAQQFLKAVEARFTGRGGTKRTINQFGTELEVYDLPPAGGDDKPVVTVYFIRDDVLCGVNGREEADAMLARFAGTPKDNLRSVAAYQTTMDRCRRASGGVQPEARFFAEPFGLAWTARTISKAVRSRYDKDIAKILADQGFDAVQGVGGWAVLMSPQNVDVQYRVAIYAPPVKGKENDPLRWNLAMRMLQLPNTSGLVPQSWVPRMSARYASYSVDILNAFDHFGTLFDAMQGHEDAFKTSMEGIEQDRYGPQVNVRDDFIAHLGNRVTLLTDYATPISVKSERSVFAIEVANEAKLAATLAKIMEKEPDVERRQFGQFIIWERIPKAQIESHEVAVPGFSSLQTDPDQDAAEEEERERVLPNSAVCVALGQLFMASDIDFLKELLDGFGQREMLISDGTYQQVSTQMEKFAPGERSGWSFTRTDEAFRPTYELIRQGKMPEAETMLGKFLNELLTTEVEKEEGILRKQRLDGSQLPNFERVRRYFGPAGRVLRSDPDGWLLTGAVLNKEAP